MAEFLNLEPTDEDNEGNDDEYVVSEDGNVSDNNFIDDSIFDEPYKDLYAFENVTRSTEDALNDMLLYDHECQKANNYCREDFDITAEKIGEFHESQTKIEEFKKALPAPYGQPTCDAFYKSVCFVIRFITTEKTTQYDNEQLKKEIDNKDLFNLLSAIKETLELDLDIQNFDNQYFAVNSILNKHNLLLRVYELKDKFHGLNLRNSDKNNILKEVSSCLTEKFNGFRIVATEQEKKIRKKFRLVNIIYKPI